MVELIVQGEVVSVFSSVDEAIYFAEREWLVDYEIKLI